MYRCACHHIKTHAELEHNRKCSWAKIDSGSEEGNNLFAESKSAVHVRCTVPSVDVVTSRAQVGL
jgi:hypothetical protein